VTAAVCPTRPGGLVFLGQAVRAPVTTGAIAPSGRALAHALAAPVLERSGTDLRVLEVGAGTGSVTRTLTRLLGPRSRLDVVEANGAFVPGLVELTRGAAADVRVHHDRIEDVELDTDYDVVVAALPFTNLPLPEVTAVLARLYRHTRRDGVLTWFGYRGTALARALTAGPASTARHRAVQRHLASMGGSSATVWANLPPARVTRLRPHG